MGQSRPRSRLLLLYQLAQQIPSQQNLCQMHQNAVTRVGHGVPKGMLGPSFLSCANRLACMGLVSRVIVPSGAICRGILPSSRLAQPGVLYFIFI